MAEFASKGVAGTKPLPTLAKDVNRPSGRVSGTCGYPPNASRKEKHLFNRT